MKRPLLHTRSHISDTKGALIAAIIAALATSMMASTVWAGIYSVRLLPSVTQATTGNTFSVALKANMVIDMAATGKVSGSVTFPANLVQLQGVVAGDYPQITLTTSNGSITVTSPDKGAGKGYGGQPTLFTATFKAVAPGSATFAAVGGSMIVNGTNHTVVPGTVDITGCPSGYTGTPPNCVAPTPPAQPTTPSPTPPQPTNSTPATTPHSVDQPTASTPKSAPTPSAHATAPQTSGSSTATITEITHNTTPTSLHAVLQASEPLHDVRVVYGTSRDALFTIATVLQNGSTIDFEAHNLQPSTLYYFKLTASDGVSKDITYQISYATRDYPVKIHLAASNTHLASRKVTINNTPYATDADGVVTVSLAPGNYTVTDTETGRSTAITVTRAKAVNGQNPDTQDFTFQLVAAKPKSHASPATILISGIGTAMLVAGVLYLSRRAHAGRPIAETVEGNFWGAVPAIFTVDKTEAPSFEAAADTSSPPLIQPNENESDDAAIAAVINKKKHKPNPVNKQHNSTYVETEKPAINANAKSHKHKSEQSEPPKVEGVRAQSRLETIPEDNDSETVI